MKKIAVLLIFLCMLFVQPEKLLAQNNLDISSLPLNIVPANADSSKPFIVYITGDGGWNKFSQSLCRQFAAQGYPVVALNAAKYFWNKKTALQAATDITRIIVTYQRLWKKNKILLLGYSFGADVMPFIHNHLNNQQLQYVVNVGLISPSANTDFEIHISGLFGKNSGGESVPAAINKINNKTVLIITGDDEDDFPFTQLTISNYKRIILPGGHHYDSNELNVVNAIISRISKQ